MRRPMLGVIALVACGLLAAAGPTTADAANRTPASPVRPLHLAGSGSRPFGLGFPPPAGPTRVSTPDHPLTPSPGQDQDAYPTPSPTPGVSTSAPASAGATSSPTGSPPGVRPGPATTTAPPPPAPPRPSGLAAIVAQSPSAQQANQILGVVASGSSAGVHLFEKQPDGTWADVLDTSGHVGAAGVGPASESSTATPRGSWPLTMGFGTGPNPGAGLPYRQTDAQSCWISDVNDPQYNTWQERLSCPAPNEQLASETIAYQYAIVIGYNTSRVPGAGSAFFVHVDTGAPTAGCVSVPRGVMLTLMQRIHPGARIVNVTSPGELAAY